jgi:phasin
MANSPKKSAAAAAAAAVASSAVSFPAMERAMEEAAVIEPTVATFEPEPTPVVVSTPAAPILEAAIAPVLDMTPILDMEPKMESEAFTTSEVAAQPVADASHMLQAPTPSLTEAQSKVRDFVETRLSETHSKYAKMKSAADEAAQALETSYASVKQGAVQFNVKALEAVSETAHANFDFFKSMFTVKSPSDYVTLQTEFARKQIEMMTAQTKAFGELAKKLAVETVEPIKAQVAKTFNMH